MATVGLASSQLRAAQPIHHRSRIAEIDGLRALAVGMVFANHVGVLHHGMMGVDLFFVISGFVITKLLHEHRPSIRHFYVNRIIRLFPPLLLVVLACTVLLALGVRLISWSDIAPAVLSYMNWARIFDLVDNKGGVLGHFWSLAIEEQFYLLWPTLFFALCGGGMNARLRWMLVVIIGAVLAWRFVLAGMGADETRLYNGFDTRADQLAFGCLLYTLPRGWIRPLAWPALTAFAALSIFGHSLDPAIINPLYVLGSLLCFLVVGAVADGRQDLLGTLLRWQPVQWAGSRSYAIYLWHYPAIQLCHTFATAHGIRAALYVPAAGAITLALSELTWQLVEKPLHRFRRRRDRAAADATLEPAT